MAVRRVLRIPHDAEATFLERPNRFLGIVNVPGSGEEKVHVHDPGRLKELLYPGNRVLVRRAGNPNRKTGWDLIAAKHDDEWVLVNSAHHRHIAVWALENGLLGFTPLRIRPEVKVGDSRLDFVLESEGGERTYVEVKGCTLAENGVALFPDAPTSRGARHMTELKKLAEEGHGAVSLVLAFRGDSRCFLPYRERDPAFHAAFVDALEAGVDAKVLLFGYEDGWVVFKREIPLCPGLR